MQEGKDIHSAYPLIDIISALGEGAIWNHNTSELYWVDIENGQLFTYNPAAKRLKDIGLGQKIGTVVPTTSKEVVLVALQDGIYKLNLTSKELELLEKCPYDPTQIRFNDGKCDPAGRFWVGTMGLNSEPGFGSLYRYEKNRTLTQVLKDVSVSNGLCWSHDEQTFYYIDTPQRNIKAFDYDITSGAIENGRVVVDLSDVEGYPDGMTIDAEGKLWVALWGGSRVVRCDPHLGCIMESITVPAKNITSCAFGGKDLKTLFITTARIKMSPGEHKAYPMAGAIFSANPDVAGVENYFFKW